jgi:hypothetical protein
VKTGREYYKRKAQMRKQGSRYRNGKFDIGETGSKMKK